MMHARLLPYYSCIPASPGEALGRWLALPRTPSIQTPERELVAQALLVG